MRRALQEAASTAPGLPHSPLGGPWALESDAARGSCLFDFGDWQGKPGHDHVELTDKATGRHLSLRFQDDVMVGCNAVGWTEHIGVMRGLVEGQIKLGEWKDKLMQDPTRLVQAYQAAALGQHDWSGGKTGRKR